MTHTDSKYLSDAAGQTRTEEQAREERVFRNFRDVALAAGVPANLIEEREASQRNVFSLRDAIMGAGK